MNIDAQFLEEAKASHLDDETQKRLIEQLELIIATVDQVQKGGKRAKLPKGWRYNETLHELVIAGPMHLVTRRLLDVAIQKDGVSATGARQAAATHNVILSLKVV